MELFSPNKVNESAKRQEQEKLLKANQIDELISKGIKSINQMRTFRETEKVRIDNELMLHQQKVNQEIAELNLQLSSLKKEREEALKPINSRIEEITERENALKTQFLELEEKRSSIDNDLHLIREKEQSIIKIQQDTDNKLKLIRETEQNVADKEKVLAETQIMLDSAKEIRILAEKNLEFARATIKSQQFEIENRDSQATVKEQALLKREQELNNRERIINDKYKTFERAQKRII